MKSSMLFSLGLIVCACTQSSIAQSFQPRAPRAAQPSTTRPVLTAENAESSSGVSSDLLELYGKTKAVRSEADVTGIARSCSKVIPDTARSKTDREYAASLLAWALNRRGEMRSELAAQMVEKDEVKEATQLDRLAVDDFTTAVRYAPRNWRMRHNLAIALAMKGDYPGSIEQLTNAIEFKPDYPNAYFNRGELYFELQQYTFAINDYTSAIELNGNDPQYYNSRAHCLFLLESHEDAIADYRRAAELGSDSAVYQTDLADAYQFLGRWEDAAKAYRAAVAINNQLPRAYQNAAWLMATCPDAKLKNVELALSAAKKAIELSGTRTPQGLDTLAAATAASGKYADAVNLMQQAVEMSTDKSERNELTQRLQLYQRGQAYVQPQSLAAAQRTNTGIRTASGTDANSR